MRQLLDYYNHHMKMEETLFFPIALRVLSEDDWAEIDTAIVDRDDPLADETEQQFRLLREKISELAQQHAESREAHTMLLAEADYLQNFVTVGQFNSSMSHHDVNIRLLAHAERGYRLEVGGRLLTEIPACSEARAVWCAYFFLKGQDGPTSTLGIWQQLRSEFNQL